MITKFKRIAILIIISIVTTFNKCQKGLLGCAETEYNFKLSVKASPDKDSIQIGDTIWIELNQPVILTDLSRQIQVDYSNAKNLGCGLSFLKFIGGDVNNPGVENAAISFSTKLIEGNEIQSLLPERIKSFNFLEENDKYRFKIAIIPMKAGIFSIGISNASNVYRKADKCTKAFFRINFENTDQHLHYLEDNRPGYVIEGMELTNLYCFKVY